MKGLKFTPTPLPNITELKSEVQHFTRKLRLAEFFNSDESGSESDEETEVSLVKNKSKFCPPHNRNKALESYIANLHSQPLQAKNIKANLSSQEKKALHDLQSDSSITIKEADKGGSVVLMDTDYYVTKVKSMLNDERFYSKVPMKREQVARSKVDSYATKYHTADEITDKESEFLTEFECRTSQFYGLPKIHKSKEIEKTVQEQNSEYIKLLRPGDLKFRPIVGGPQCPTHRISNLMDIILKPLAQKVNSYLRDTMDFLNKLPSEVSEDSILVTYDVSSLYSVIPHELGIEAVKYWYDKFKSSLPRHFSKEMITEGLEIILRNNTFMFLGEMYLQEKGTAMGTKVAPTYATLVLGYLEETLYQKVEDKFGREAAHHVYNSWKRFLDDCFMIWKLRFGNIDDFTHILNELHPDFNFVTEQSQSSLPFLDVKVIKKRNKIITDLHHKVTDTRRYVPYNSSHPGHTRRNIPYSLARRVAMIVDDKDLRRKQLDQLKTDLLKCSYPKKLVSDAIHKYSNVSSQSLRTPKQKESGDILTFVSTYIPGNPDLFPIIKASLPILDKNPKMERIMSKKTLIKSLRQPKNLKRMLTTSKCIGEEVGMPPCVKKCLRPNCNTCRSIIEGDSYYFKDCNRNFKVKHDMDCTSKSVIYCLECASCKEIYIGQTGGPLNLRMNVHRQHITHQRYRILPVSHHIATCAAGMDPKFKVFPFYKANNMDDTQREMKEQFFIDKLKPKLNSTTNP